MEHYKKIQYEWRFEWEKKRNIILENGEPAKIGIVIWEIQ
jgi:hypothetical protein